MRINWFTRLFMFTKYKIQILRYRSVQDMKKQTFPIVRKMTNSTFQTELKKVFDSKNVYPIGYHYFNKTTNIYETSQHS